MSTPAVLIATFKLRPGQEDTFAAWQSQHQKIVARFPGYLGSDLMPPIKPGDHEWTILLHFRSPELLDQWQRSEERGKLIGEVLPLIEGGNLGELMPKDNSVERPDTLVTQIILSKVRPGMEEAYREWAGRIQQAQAKYPGYRGMYLQPPTSDQNGRWTTLLRYDTQQHLDIWLAAPERAELLRESKAFIEDEELMRLATSFPGWVPIDPATGKGPPNWKTAFLVLVGLYPVVMLEPRLTFLNAAVSMFIGNCISVAITTFITMPLLIRWFGWWLFLKEDSPRGTTAKGVVIFLVIFALEITLFSRL